MFKEEILNKYFDEEEMESTAKRVVQAYLDNINEIKLDSELHSEEVSAPETSFWLLTRQSGKFGLYENLREHLQTGKDYTEEDGFEARITRALTREEGQSFETMYRYAIEDQGYKGSFIALDRNYLHENKNVNYGFGLNPLSIVDVMDYPEGRIIVSYEILANLFDGISGDKQRASEILNDDGETITLANKKRLAFELLRSDSEIDRLSDLLVITGIIIITSDNKVHTTSDEVFSLKEEDEIVSRILREEGIKEVLDGTMSKASRVIHYIAGGESIIKSTFNLISRSYYRSDNIDNVRDEFSSNNGISANNSPFKNSNLLGLDAANNKVSKAKIPVPFIILENGQVKGGDLINYNDSDVIGGVSVDRSYLRMVPDLVESRIIDLISDHIENTYVEQTDIRYISKLSDKIVKAANKNQIPEEYNELRDWESVVESIKEENVDFYNILTKGVFLEAHNNHSYSGFGNTIIAKEGTERIYGEYDSITTAKNWESILNFREDPETREPLAMKKSYTYRISNKFDGSDKVVSKEAEEALRDSDLDLSFVKGIHFGSIQRGEEVGLINNFDGELSKSLNVDPEVKDKNKQLIEDHNEGIIRSYNNYLVEVEGEEFIPIYVQDNPNRNVKNKPSTYSTFMKSKFYGLDYTRKIELANKTHYVDERELNSYRANVYNESHIIDLDQENELIKGPEFSSDYETRFFLPFIWFEKLNGLSIGRVFTFKHTHLSSYTHKGKIYGKTGRWEEIARVATYPGQKDISLFLPEVNVAGSWIKTLSGNQLREVQMFNTLQTAPILRIQDNETIREVFSDKKLNDKGKMKLDLLANKNRFNFSNLVGFVGEEVINNKFAKEYYERYPYLTRAITSKGGIEFFDDNDEHRFILETMMSTLVFSAKPGEDTRREIMDWLEEAEKINSYVSKPQNRYTAALFDRASNMPYMAEVMLLSFRPSGTFIRENISGKRSLEAYYAKGIRAMVSLFDRAKENGISIDHSLVSEVSDLKTLELILGLDMSNETEFNNNAMIIASMRNSFALNYTYIDKRRSSYSSKDNKIFRDMENDFRIKSDENIREIKELFFNEKTLRRRSIPENNNSRFTNYDYEGIDEFLSNQKGFSDNYKEGIKEFLDNESNGLLKNIRVYDREDYLKAKDEEDFNISRKADFNIRLDSIKSANTYGAVGRDMNTDLTDISHQSRNTDFKFDTEVTVETFIIKSEYQGRTLDFVLRVERSAEAQRRVFNPSTAKISVVEANRFYTQEKEYNITSLFDFYVNPNREDTNKELIMTDIVRSLVSDFDRVPDVYAILVDSDSKYREDLKVVSDFTKGFPVI